MNKLAEYQLEKDGKLLTHNELNKLQEIVLNNLKNSTLLKELVKRIKSQAIRFNYSNLYLPQKISGLISWDATDEYELDLAELEEYLEKHEKN